MFKPLLAANVTDETQIPFPCYVSPKYDGIRALGTTQGLLSRSLKPIPNQQLQLAFKSALLRDPSLAWLDYEIMLDSNPAAVGNTFNDIQSTIMSTSGKSRRYHLYAFDHLEEPETSFTTRLANLKSVFGDSSILIYGGTADTSLCIHLVPQVYCINLHHLTHLETTYLAKGYEGLMIRKPSSPYKYGRSTIKQASLLKLKKFLDTEALVTGFTEQLHNSNEATTGELGQTKRSKHQANLIPKDTLGAIVAEHPTFGRIEIGTGFTYEQRQDIWSNQYKYLGTWVKFKYFPVGIKDKPRFPVFLGFRSTADMST